MLRPYQLQVNDEYSYEFIAGNGVKYKIYFIDYSFMFEDYPSINSPVYSFNIEAIDGDPDHSRGDDRIGVTIFDVFNRFFKEMNNVAVYVCDSTDDRQYSRKRKFDFWFFTYNDGSLIKEDGLAIVEGVEIYNAMILRKQHAQLTELILAFKDLNERANEK